ncbi:MAG: aminotransferase class I/II-fold pyridoxal phosphate-dependent enzyme [Clostridia bacterium]|nr:aminotransferase class I/II-fold pyridoxal phosphate-dependent enzyme [Clostridia bacterium]
MDLKRLTADELVTELEAQLNRYDKYMQMGLSLDMTRGKPCPEQLKLSEPMLCDEILGDHTSESGTDCRNYGVLAGLPEARRFMGELLGVPGDNIICGGNSSLNMMYDTMCSFMLFGVSDDEEDRPWSESKERKFICPVPGYDRHFAITQLLGFKLIPVDIIPDGLDMDEVERIVKDDPSVKGIWSVPKYSNPTGYVYSDECIRRLARMECAAKDFRIFWDDAYTVHFINGEPAKQLSLFDECAKAGNPDRVIVFGSTSKITFPGAGISALAADKKTVDFLLSRIAKQTIGPDKLNQLRHVKFLKNVEGVVEHMKKHAVIMKPKFDAVEEVFENEFGSPLEGQLEWTKPEGGYFICCRTGDGMATEVLSMCKQCGVAFTPAGSTHPYKIDPTDSYVRIAPSYPDVPKIKSAVEIFCICVKIVLIKKLLEAKKEANNN